MAATVSLRAQRAECERLTLVLNHIQREIGATEQRVEAERKEHAHVREAYQKLEQRLAAAQTKYGWEIFCVSQARCRFIIRFFCDMRFFVCSFSFSNLLPSMFFVPFHD